MMWEKSLSQLDTDIDGLKSTDEEWEARKDVLSGIIKAIPIASVSMAAVTVTVATYDVFIALIPCFALIAILIIGGVCWHLIKKGNEGATKNKIQLSKIQIEYQARTTRATTVFEKLSYHPEIREWYPSVPFHQFSEREKYDKKQTVEEKVDTRMAADLRYFDNELIDRINSLIELSNKYYINLYKFSKDAKHYLDDMAKDSPIEKTLYSLDKEFGYKNRIRMLLIAYLQNKKSVPIDYSLFTATEIAFLSTILSGNEQEKYPLLLKYGEFEQLALEIEDQRTKMVSLYDLIERDINYQFSRQCWGIFN